MYILECISSSTCGVWGGGTLKVLECISSNTCGVWGGGTLKVLECIHSNTCGYGVEEHCTFWGAYLVDTYTYTVQNSYTYVATFVYTVKPL